MNSLSLKAKLTSGFGVLLAILTTMSLISYMLVQKLSDLSAFNDQKAQGRFYASSIDSIINNQKAEYRAYLLDDQQAEMDRFAENSRTLSEDFDKLEGTLSTDRGREMAAHFRQASAAYHGIIDRIVELHRNGKQKEATDLMKAPGSDVVRADLAKTIADLLSLQNKLKTDASAEQVAAESRTTTILVCLALVGVALGIVLATLITRSITGGIGQMVNVIEEVAANNLVVADLEIASQDEIGRAGLSLNRMKNNLREMIESIAGTAEHVASASEEISSSATQQSQSAETQTNQTTQVATAMQEMSSTVLQVSENSNKAAEASRQAAETAREGGQIVEETLNKMRVIADSVGATAKKMEELGKSSDQIGRIAGVIDDIADQTNLLALNAAIEAARAGEQGRGFAVVADEVRKLAERTTTATKEIAQMIKNIQDETKTAVTAMEAGTKQVEDGVQSTSRAGDSLKQIIHMSEQVGEMITHIATAATEQSSASEEINNNMDQISKLVKESSDGAQQSAKACQDLSGLALDLQNMVGKFNVGNGTGHSARGQARRRSNISQRIDEAKSFAAAAR